MKVLLTGGTGFVGGRLAKELAGRGDEVCIVTRDPSKVAKGAGIDATGWPPSADGFDAVVHLAGEPVIGKRWSARQKERLRASRIETANTLVEAVRVAERKPRVFVGASAVGYYGDRGDEELTEDSAPGDDFLARLCRDWEAAAVAAAAFGPRVVNLRIGIVLGPEGGALSRMLTPFKLGVGGPIGSGRNWMSWIHVGDLCGLIRHALDREHVSGPLHGTAPHPVKGGEFASFLGHVLHRPALFPVPEFVLRIPFGEGASVLTASQRCSAERAQSLGYRFAHPELEGALRDLLGR